MKANTSATTVIAALRSVPMMVFTHVAVRPGRMPSSVPTVSWREGGHGTPSTVVGVACPVQRVLHPLHGAGEIGGIIPRSGFLSNALPSPPAAAGRTS